MDVDWPREDDAVDAKTLLTLNVLLEDTTAALLDGPDCPIDSETLKEVVRAVEVVGPRRLTTFATAKLGPSVTLLKGTAGV